ncbi:MAG: DMT family transporter [Candidatus Thermoplasmatota archaeon]|nr:DMT family transporter [Candidatus Thermoplasmatota archaeon]
MELLWLPFSLATIIMYGLGQVFAKETRTQISSANMLVLFGANVLILYSVYWFVFGDGWSHGGNLLLEAAVAAGLSGAAFVTYYESLKHGKVSVVGTIAGAYAPWTVVLALVFLGETMSTGEGLGVALVVSAMLLFAYIPNNGNGNKKTELLGIVFASMSLFFWGSSAAMAKGVITDIGNTDFIGVYALICPTIWIVYWLATERGKFEMPKSNKWLLELSMLFIAGGGITLYLAIENGNVSIVSPVTNLYPVLTIAVAKLRLKEKLNLRQSVALAMLIASIPLFSL